LFCIFPLGISVCSSVGSWIFAYIKNIAQSILLEKSSTLVAEQCAWAIGNVAGEGADLRSTLIAQGALRPLARLMLSNKGSTSRTAAWALSNLIKVYISCFDYINLKFLMPEYNSILFSTAYL
jgi:hypothetical protein